MRKRKSPRLWGAAAAALAVSAVLLTLAGAAGAYTTAAIYDSIPVATPPNVPSQPFQAQQTAEFGDHIQFAGTNRYLTTVTVLMSAHSKHSDYLAFSPLGWVWPITLKLYNVIPGSPPSLGPVITSQTVNQPIPWRPEHDASCPGDSWLASDNQCYTGLAFKIIFDFTGLNLFLPNELIWGISYNTQTWGANPTGVGGPYDSLNMGLNNIAPPTTGTDPNDDDVWWNTSTASLYTDGGAGGVGTFRRDTCWGVCAGGPYIPAATFVASDTPPSPTAVTMRSFTAKRSAGTTTLRWRTGSETAALGYNVYGEVQGTRVKVNTRLIASRAGVAGSSYSFTYRQPEHSRAVVRFWIQAVSTAGSRTWFGPARVGS